MRSAQVHKKAKVWEAVHSAGQLKDLRVYKIIRFVRAMGPGQLQQPHSVCQPKYRIEQAHLLWMI